METDGLQSLLAELRADRDAAVDGATKAGEAIRDKCAWCVKRWPECMCPPDCPLYPWREGK